jgi:hypothetical protein
VSTTVERDESEDVPASAAIPPSSGGPSARRRSRHSSPGRRRRRRGRRVSAFVVVLALVFFFAPAVSYLFGGRPQAIDNRPLAKFPSVSDGWKFFPELGTWATDHLNGRKQAVRANNEVSQNLFHEQPNDPQTTTKDGYVQVVRGRDGWLYLGDDFKNKCQPVQTPTQVIAQLRELDKIVTDSGRRFVVTVAPDKSGIYPQHLPSNFVGKDCSAAFAASFWSALQAARLPGYVDSRSVLLAAAAGHLASLPLPAAVQAARIAAVAGDGPYYRPKDTHWDAAGVVLDGQLLAAALDPAVAAGRQIASAGTSQPVGDLTYLLGLPAKDTLPAFVVPNPGVTMQAGSSLLLQTDKVNVVRNTSSGAPLYQPKTLLLGDSFFDTSKAFLGSYFTDAAFLHNKSNPQVVANAMIDRTTVVLEISERLVAPGFSPLLSAASLKTIQSVLAAHPLP